MEDGWVGRRVGGWVSGWVGGLGGRGAERGTKKLRASRGYSSNYTTAVLCIVLYYE